MSNTSGLNRARHITTGDVLEDLGFTAEEIRETEIKMTIWRPLRAEVDARRLTQTELASLLQVHQPDASLLVRGKLSKFSVTRLMQFAERLGLTVRLMVKPSASARGAKMSRPRSSVSAGTRGSRLAAKRSVRADCVA
jgi:predicted XRE-type DNA-binding protein